MSVPTICFNLNGIHDSVWKALRTANQDRVTPFNSHALSRILVSSRLKIGEMITEANMRRS
jgi:hypothetical protein